MEVSSLRYGNFDPDDIDEILDQRQIWRSALQRRWPKELLDFKRKEITQQVRDNLHDFAAVMSAIDMPYKLVISVSNLWIYANEMSLLEELDRLPYLRYKKFTEAVIDRPADTILMKDPSHRYRCYLRGVKVTEIEKERLREFLQNYTDIRISPSLRDWLKNPKYVRIMDYHFVDYNDTGWEVFLGLVRPGIIRKTMQIMAK